MRKSSTLIPADVAAVNREIRAFLTSVDDAGQPLGKHRCGIYAFYDYDAEPIYVGQTTEGLGVRIQRHLTNQRTDAVAMKVLDPFEVAEIEVWPLDASVGKSLVDSYESVAYALLVESSKFHAILNEKPVKLVSIAAAVTLPKSYRRRIIPEDVFVDRINRDVRIARRSTTIAALAKIISERDVSAGLRVALHTQAKRLEFLVQERINEINLAANELKKAASNVQTSKKGSPRRPASAQRLDVLLPEGEKKITAF